MNIPTKIALAILLAMPVTVLPVAQAQKSPPNRPRVLTPLPATDTARVVDLFGKTAKKAPGASDYTPLAASPVLTPQTMLRTGEDSAMLLLLPEGHYLRLGEKTVVVLNQLGKGKSFSVKVLSGQVWAGVRNRTTKFEVRTPSCVTTAKSALFGVGYDLETNQSMVSTGDGSVTVSLSSGGWRGTVPAGQYVRYLRNPEPNIRLRAPEVLAQDEAQKAMWQVLRSENWTKHSPPGDNGVKLKRGQEKQLRQLTFSVSVDE
ncbi:MAG: FecR domain-containing protein [Akkermansiaceae bacterium]|nr:FecR domain-containing protein [Armatimonadota bacterium]